MKKRFYAIHVSYGRMDGYPCAAEIESMRPLTDEQVIQFAIDNDLFTEADDATCVDYVREIDEYEYNLITQL